jgi:hypothetical protein
MSEGVSDRRRAWRLHTKAIALMGVLAVAMPLLDPNFKWGATGWDGLPNLLTDAVWITVILNALLSTSLVAIFAKRRAIALAIELASPVVVLSSLFVWVVSNAPPGPPASAEPAPVGAAVPKAAAACLTSLDSWSWSEPDRFSARIELQVTTPGPATVTVDASAKGLDAYLLSTHQGIKHELPAGRSTLSVELERAEPGRPNHWRLSFECIKPRAFVRYESGESEHVDRIEPWEMVRPLPAATAAPPPPTTAPDEYDLFVGSGFQHGFVLRPAAQDPLAPGYWSAERKLLSPMEALPGELARLGHGTVLWWPVPDLPYASQVRTIQAACRKAGVSLRMPSRFLPQPGSPPPTPE